MNENSSAPLSQVLSHLRSTTIIMNDLATTVRRGLGLVEHRRLGSTGAHCIVGLPSSLDARNG